MPWWFGLVPIAAELGEFAWNQIVALSQGKLPTYSELMALNDEVQKKIDAQKAS